MSQLDRRQALKLFASIGAAGVAAPVLSACGGSSLGGQSSNENKGSVKIGLLLPQSGIYKSLGDDMTNGFELYRRLNGGKLGGYEAELVYADEGETAKSGIDGAEKLLKQDKVLALSGVVSSATMLGIKEIVETAKVPLIGANASPTNLNTAGQTGANTNVKFIWRTSYVNDEPGIALGKYVAEKLKGDTCFLIAANYQAGKDEIDGFMKTFGPAGGKVEGSPVYTPFAPTPTDNYAPFLNQIKNSKAKAVFCFYAGSAAATFVKQYADFGLKSIPLYAPGFLTEGAGLLKAQGEAAKDIYTSMNYSADLDNGANRKFASEYQKAYNTTPTTYAMASYDAATVLDKALELVEGDVNAQSLNAAIGKVGQIESPRGSWQFNQNRTPLQKWYLRQVKIDGTVMTNSVVSELTTLG